MDLLALPLVHQRADPVGPTAGFGDQCVNERIRRSLHHVDAFHRNADLTRVGERSERDLLGRPARLDASIDDQRVVAAVLQQCFGAALSTRAGDRSTGSGASDVGHDIDLLGCGQPGTNRAVAVEDLEHTDG